MPSKELCRAFRPEIPVTHPGGLSNWPTVALVAALAWIAQVASIFISSPTLSRLMCTFHFDHLRLTNELNIPTMNVLIPL